MVDKANLDDRDLFLFCDSVIAGALIFLTITAIAANNPADKSFRVLSSIFGLGIMILFSITSYCIVVGSRAWGLRFLETGLIFIGVAAFLLIMLNSTIFQSTNLPP